MATKALDKARIRAYQKALSEHLRGLTPREVEEAALWYPSAGVIAEDIARIMGTSMEVGACILSAFSPRTPWARNIVNAYTYANGGTVSGMKSWTTAADKCRTLGFDGLGGPKTNAFARAIAGDPDAVVIDVWMSRAAGLDSDAPTIVQYREISAAVTALARKHGLTPATMQALIWGRVRGGLD